MRISKVCLVPLFAVAIVWVASLDAQATGRARCRRSEVPMPPGNYAIVVAGSDENDVADAIRRVVGEEQRSRPSLFRNATIEILNGDVQLPATQKAVAVVTIGNVSGPAPDASNNDHLRIAVPKIYDKDDPKYVRSVKVDTAAIHL